MLSSDFWYPFIIIVVTFFFKVKENFVIFLIFAQVDVLPP
jgi:hypothetical protein